MKEVLKLSSVKMLVDTKSKTAIGVFDGDVKFEDYQKLLITGAKLAKAGKVENVIMDRSSVGKLDAECRVWVKQVYFKDYVKPLIPQMRKIAVVESKSLIGKIYGSTIYKTLSLIFPTLTFKSFDTLNEAQEWVKSDIVENEIEISDITVGEKTNIDEVIEESIYKNAKIKRSAILTDRSEVLVTDQNEMIEETTDDSKNSFFNRIFSALFS